MRRFDLKTVDDAELVFRHGEYIVLAGKHPWIFRKDGSYIAKIKRIKHAYMMVFLSQDRVLMDGGGDGFYHYVSLETGETLWSIVKKGRRYYCPVGFAVSEDNQRVCYVYRNGQDLNVDYFDLENGSATTYKIPGIKGSVYCGYCKNDGRIFLLRFWFEKTQDFNASGQQITQKQVDIFSFDPISSLITWEHRWQNNDVFSDMVCCFNEQFVLLKNLHAVKISTLEVTDLIENSPQVQHPNGGLTVVDYDPCTNILTVWLTATCSTLLIDCKNRKIVSHYLPISRGLSSGRLIDGEFWMGTYDGIGKKPFPKMEPFPKELLR